MAEATTTLDGHAGGGRGGASRGSRRAAQQHDRALSAPQLAPADRDRAIKLHARGEEQLGRGNIYAARQFFERAAEAGLAESALALAATYDAAELARLRVVGPEAGAGRGQEMV